MTALGRNVFIGMGLIFLLALALRLGLTHQFVGLGAQPDYNANSDQMDYELLAWRMAEGKPYAITEGKPTASRTPGTSMSLLPAYAAFGRSFTAGRVWFCILSALTCSLVVWLGAICINRPAGILAGLGLALYPAHAYNAMHFVSETPFGFWIVLALIASVIACHRQRGGWWIDALAGVFWAMAVYTRPQMLLAVPIAGALVLIACLLRDRRIMLHSAVQVALLALVLSPWVIRNTVVMGKPTMSTIVGYGLWGSHNDKTFNDPAQRGGWVKASELIDDAHPLTGGEVERNDQALHYGVDAIKANLDKMPSLIVAKLWRLVAPMRETDNRLAQLAFAAGWMALWPMLLMGVVLLYQRHALAAWVLMLPVLATLASTVLFYGSDRFRDSIAPVMLVLAGAARTRFTGCLPATDSRQPAGGSRLSRKRHAPPDAGRPSPGCRRGNPHLH